MLFLPTFLAPLIVPLYLLYFSFPPTPIPPHLTLTIALYVLSTFLELLAEPYYLLTLSSWETLTSRRVRIEGAAMVVKAVGTLGTVSVGGEQWALVAFGVGQVGYALVLLLGLGWIVGFRSIWGTHAVEEGVKKEGKKEEGFLNKELKTISWALTKQSLVKQFLTESDKLVVGRLSELKDQGGYAIALNYGTSSCAPKPLADKFVTGSLIARILFQPLEESSRLFYSRTLSAPFPTLPSLLLSSALLHTLLKLHLHLSLILLLLLPSYTSPLIFHLLGQKWSLPNSTAPTLLAAYVGRYLPLMGINGITEAFVAAVATPDQIREGSRWLGVCSVGFLMGVASLWEIGRGRGGVGEGELIWLAGGTMVLRILYSLRFIVGYFGTRLAVYQKDSSVKGKTGVEEVQGNLQLGKILPKWPTVLFFILSSLLVRNSESQGHWRSLEGMGQHVLLGAGCGVACLGIM